MIYFLITTLGILAFISPKSRLVAFFLFCLMWLLWGWNTWNGDYDAYQLMYETIGQSSLGDSSVEFGYRFLNYLFYNLGFTFSQFISIYSFIVLSLVYCFVRKSSFPALFSFLYFIIFIMGYVFMRNYIADALFFIFYIISLEQYKHKLLKSILVLILALLFHNTAFLYLLFLLIYVPKLTTKKLFYLTVVIVFVIGTSLSFFLSFIGSDIIKAKIDYYKSNDNPIGPAIAHIIIALAPIIFLRFNKLKGFRKSENVRATLLIMQKINVLTLIYLPLYFFIPDFGRFFRVLIPISFFFVLFMIYHCKNTSSKFALIAILVGIYLIAIYQFSYSTLEFTFYPLFESNLIFSIP